jgi:CBS domain-containing protein
MLEAGHLDQPMRALMKSPVHTVPLSATLSDAAYRMRSLGVRHMVVVADGNRPVGMVSQTDVIRHQGMEFFVHAREVSSVVRAAPLAIDASAPLSGARLAMAEARCDAMVVEDAEAGHGILTARDVMRSIAERRLDAAVREFSSFPLLTVPLSASLFSARKLFQEHQIRHLGVSDGGRVVGTTGCLPRAKPASCACRPNSCAVRSNRFSNRPA